MEKNRVEQITVKNSTQREWAGGHSREAEMQHAWEELVEAAMKKNMKFTQRLFGGKPDMTNFDWSAFQVAMKQYEEEENDGRFLSPHYATVEQVRKIIKRMQ